jgi:alpha-D-xyloside xylohydrolase
MQYVGEKSWDQLELRVYPGADGRFVLYEDEGDSYRYEQGAYSTITMTWNDRQQTLTLGERQGSFPGMLQKRRFTIVMPDGRRQQVDYNGQEQTVKW